MTFVTSLMESVAGPDGLVPHSYDAGFVILSYMVSLAGCWTSLELLHRRTGARGYYNWYLLLAAASTMGAVSIWSMHYIGNRAIVMANGQRNVQIQYSPGFTAGSFFLPIVVVGIAFYFFSTSETVSILWTLMGGLLTGFAVCGMHYMGQGGIANYEASYMKPYVVGSAVIAVVATTVSLGIFFYFNSKWTNSWWKRALCASLLAVAVSGMHWVATVGTSYHVTPHEVEKMVGLSREATVVVVICLAIGCCMILVTFALIGQRSRQRSADRAQQVVLACATFDPDGKLMVTPEGLLPCRKITDSYLEWSFEEVFDVDHPVFCWIFRASRCWRCVADLIPGIRTHLRRTMPIKPRRGSDTSEAKSSNGTNVSDYSILFRELFCVAARDLADQIQQPLEDIGVLYGGIMSTGTLSHTAMLKLRGIRLRNNALDAAERGESPPLFGRGQLLFVMRQANRAESSQLQAAGHRFATIPNVIDTLARSMEVTREELLPRLESMRAECTDEHFLQPGVHLACFALRPMFHRGFDVLVRKDAGNMLPTTLLSASKLEQWQFDILEGMDNLTVATCCELLGARSILVGDRAHKFAGELLEAITQLAEAIKNPFFGEARLVARLLRAPCASWKTDQGQSEVFLITFRVMADAHQHTSLNEKYLFTPLKFFLCQQHAYKGCPDNNVFARKIYREFAAIAKLSNEYNRRESVNSPQRSSARSWDGSFGSPRSRSYSPLKKKSWPARVHFKAFDARNCSEKHLVDIGMIRPYGGIHVSNEIDVDVSEVRSDNHSSDVEMTDLRVCSEISVGDIEGESFADELVAMTIDERKRQHTTRS